MNRPLIARLTGAAAATAVCLSLLISPSAHAFDVLRHWNSAEITTWPGANVSWRLSSSNTMPGVPPNAFQTAIENAFNTWQAVTCSTIGFNYQGYSASDPGGGIFVYVVDTQWDPSVGDAAAYSQSSTSSNGNINSNIVVFNAVDISWSTANTNVFGTSDVQGVATHEIGHSLGLDHSRHKEATMFFSGGGVALRTLSEDDTKGICFLYPAQTFGSSASCDPCNSTDDCADGNCWNWGGQFDGYTYCMDNCASDADCPDGFGCFNIGNPAVPQCYPDNEFCGQAGSNLALGEFCYGHETCSSSLCLVTGDDAFCSQQCSNDAQCGGGFVCNSGFCFKAGTKPYGAECDEDSECQSAFCIDNLKLNGGLCSSLCGNNGGSCPDGNQCYQDAVCVPPGGKPNGTSCFFGSECLSSYCNSGSCSQPCGAGNPSCPEGTLCEAGWCEGAATGGQCVSSNDCPTGLSCLYGSATATSGVCGYDCQPLANDAQSGCPDGLLCDWVWQSWNSTIAGSCVPPNGGAGLSESCADGPCEVNLICNNGVGSGPTCHKDCKLNAGSLGCNTGNEKCDDLVQDVNDPQRGICVNKFASPETGPEPSPEPTPEVGPEAGPEPTPEPAAEVGAELGSELGPEAAPDTGTEDIGGGGDVVVSNPDPGTGQPPVVLPPTGGGCASTAPSGTSWPMAGVTLLGLWALGRRRR